MQPTLLDTDMLSELIKLRNVAVQQRALDYMQHIGPITFSAITRYEVLRGYKRTNATTQLARFQVFCQQAIVLAIDDAVVEQAADLWSLAQVGGHPDNDADLIIAATAFVHRRVLATGNTRHFSWIPGLTVEDWRNP
jgi:tRNA(fMet)-specific endonuclease VapC